MQPLPGDGPQPSRGHDLLQRGYRTAHKSRWPNGSGRGHPKVVTSQIAAWLAGYGFGVRSNNPRLIVRAGCLRARRGGPIDRGIAGGGAKIKKSKKPIRKTPAFEEFQAVVADIRALPYNAEATDSGDSVEFVVCGPGARRPRH